MMNHMRIHGYRPRANKKQHKGQQLLNDFILYSLTTLACTSFCSSPLCKALFIVGNLIVIFLLGELKFFASKSKTYNDVCNLPVIYEQPEDETTEETCNHKISKSQPCEQHDEEEFFESCNDEGTCEFDDISESSIHEEDLKCSKYEGLKGDKELSLPADELNKLADDFIARIIRQRRLEAEFCRG
ncbi:hypothetical protein LXL04_030820 [Taraxacum kok-saghyz]